SPNGKYVLTAAGDRSVAWLADGTLLASSSGQQAPLRAAAWSPDGKTVVAALLDVDGGAGDFAARLWNVESLESLSRSRRKDGIFHTASLSSDGERVAAAYDDRSARIFQANGDDEPIVLKGHEGWVASAALSPDGKRVVTASFDRT